MKNVLGIVLILGMVLVAGPSPASQTPAWSAEKNHNNAGYGTPSGQGLEGPFLFSDELDDMVGDTLHLSSNWRDQQHNAGFTRLIAVHDSDEDNKVIHLTWTQHPTETGSRNVSYYKLFVDAAGDVTRQEGSPAQVGVSGAGYPVISLDPTEGAPYVMMHQPDPNGGYFSSLMTESIFVPGFFDPYDLPRPDGGDFIWPQHVVTRYDGGLYVHIISNGYEDLISENVYYHRALYDPVSSLWTNATPGGANSMFVTTYSAVLSTIPASNSDGSLIAVAGSVSRFLQGEGPDDWAESRASQSNNDIYLWTSDDGGDTWDWENPQNVTSFIAPDGDLLPDTSAANKDTLRAYSEVDVIIDGDNTIHTAFNTLSLDFFRSAGASSLNGRLWHWDSENEVYSQIADGDFWNGAQPAAWELTVCHANLYKDEETGVLWASWCQYGEPGDTLNGGPLDATAAGYANSDVYVAASPDNGLRWTKGVNVTDTRLMENALEPGESQTERDPSMAYNSDGPYLHLFYTMDYEAGISAVAGQEEGVATLNQMVYHRVPKVELMAQFEENAEWVVNYPMHIDSAGYYEDPNGWEWNGFWDVSVPEGRTLQPDQFELNQNYPNPFNPSTQINFTLHAQGQVSLTVYDLLGREVATLVNRSMSAGNHSVSFLASDLASGVYFYKLTSGDVSKVRKMILMK
ncbi:T9SS type A sorting domain-containing protein [bacterium]|nr:T9SS type A sorting domain-containing protein [bacterium]